jgi:hypothetical protein
VLCERSFRVFQNLELMRYRLRTLLIVSALAPPVLAAAYLAPIYFFAMLTYIVTLAAILPAAAYLWRNSTSR